MSTTIKLRAWSESENAFHERVAKMLDIMLQPPALWTTVALGHIRLSRAQQAILVRRGQKPGWPDLIILHGTVFGIELKVDGGGLSKGHWAPTQRGGRVWKVGQAEMFPLLRQAGMPIAVCRSDADVQAALDDWRIPHLPWR